MIIADGFQVQFDRIHLAPHIVIFEPHSTGHVLRKQIRQEQAICADIFRTQAKVGSQLCICEVRELCSNLGRLFEVQSLEGKPSFIHPACHAVMERTIFFVLCQEYTRKKY